VKLPDNFLFSQGSLQDYAECRRRFQLRYLQRLAWPALQAEPALENEHLMQRGARFHRMIQQVLSGVPADQLDPPKEEEALAQWWRNFLAFREHLPGLDNYSLSEPGDLQLYPELTLSAALGNSRLVAKFDLIAARPDGRLIIYDWKTSTHRPRRKWLAERMQTQVYPYLLVRAGQRFAHGSPLQPEQVEMVYWFAEFPEDAEHFAYNTQEFSRVGTALESLVREIEELPPDLFALTEDTDRCRFCQYRSLCDRGVQAGNLTDLALLPEPEAWQDLDLQDILEIEY
jgi:predicted RecB family nuclease